MNLLLIMPLPPPLTGQSLASQVLVDDLQEYNFKIVNLSKQSFKEGVDGVKRIFQVISILRKVLTRIRGTQCIYFTISESLAGNLKDIIIYLCCYRKLSKMIIHLHGGSIKLMLWDKYPLLGKLNQFFISKMGAVIVTGKSHCSIFSSFVSEQNLHIVPNFAQDYLFVNEKEIDQKFSKKKIKILYLSNLIPKKGYAELLHGFLKLDKSVSESIDLEFAGSFDDENERSSFLRKIKGHSNIHYHGVVVGEKKKLLFSDAHIFCLPTSYHEGQPISILEAYASGCVVLTTGQSGILDIFQDGVNGFLIDKPTSVSIEGVILSALKEKNKLLNIAKNNSREAQKKYKTHTHTAAIKRIISSIA